jgi:hypothetical protein
MRYVSRPGGKRRATGVESAERSLHEQTRNGHRSRERCAIIHGFGLLIDLFQQFTQFLGVFYCELLQRTTGNTCVETL